MQNERSVIWLLGMFLLACLVFIWVDHGRQAGYMSKCLATGRSGVECEMMLRLHGRMP